MEELKDTDMREAPPKKERTLVYNTYSDEDRQFFFIQEKLMIPFQAAKAANIYYETARKWKAAYNRDSEKNIPIKKTNCTSNGPQSKLTEDYKANLIDFFR